MPIHYVAFDLDPRKSQATSNPASPPFKLSPSEFPPLSGCRTTSTSLSKTTTQRYVDVVTGGRTHFGMLPLEVREMVWEHTLRAQGFTEREVDVKVWMVPSAGLLPPLCSSVSQGIRGESTRVYLTNNIFVIRDIASNSYFTALLETIQEGKGFKAVKELWFTSFHWFPGVEQCGESNDIKLMSRCTGLKRVKFTSHPFKFVKNKVSGSGYDLKTIDELVDFYDLQKIFMCRELRQITFDIILDVVEDCHGDPHAQIEALGAWIVEGFRKMGKTVALNVTWRQYRYRG
jgi:hypothetical protein